MVSKPGTRRKQSKSAAPRWGRLAILGLGMMLVVGSVGTWMSAWVTDPTRLPLKSIRITGELAHLDRDRLQHLVAEAIDGGFFSVDMHKLRAAAKQLAWVDEVSIRRVWPQTLVMDVTEQLPVARWGDKALVNGRGEVFKPEAGELPSGLPHFIAADEDAPAVMTFYRSASTRLSAVELKIDALVLQGRHDWRLELDNGISLLLDQSNAEAALNEFVTALPAIRDPEGRQPVRVDMRYENGFAVRWAPTVETEKKRNQRGDA